MHDSQQHLWVSGIACACICALVCACVQGKETYFTTRSTSTEAVPRQVPISTQQQTINLEAADRIARFRRLAAMVGTNPPLVDELFAPAGSVPDVEGRAPVVRLVFEERAFFDSDKASPRPEARSIIKLVAENMKRDVPDAALTLVGHTDAVGSDSYNLILAQRRASSIMSELITRDVNSNQLSTVAIGKAQPIASNATDEGRARNRRVEFLISGSEAANLAIVQDRAVNNAYLTVAGIQPSKPIRSVEVLKPVRRPTTSDDDGILGPSGMLTLGTRDRPSASTGLRDD